jgi:Tannase and feruloyl esterase
MKLRSVVVCSSVVVASLAATQALGATACEDLARFGTTNVTITVAKTVDSPAAIAANLAQASIPTPFCRVGGFITPTSDSHIGFEVWLPPDGTWNKKFEAVGNGGLSGALNYRAMISGFTRGYATMTTDLGHTNTPPNSVEDASWALGHPDKVVDYAYRAEHLSTVAAQQIVDAYYGAAPAHSYYAGCSAGGIQGLTELLRYPKDFDGYIVGAATPDHLGQEMLAFWNTLVGSLANPDEALKPAQMELVHKTILEQCSGKNGGAPGDPFLSDPPSCKFQPKTLQCKAGQDPSSCLTTVQVEMFERIYQGPVNPRTKESIYSGLTPGTELGWDRYFTGKKNPVGADRPWAGFMADMVLSDPEYLTQQKYLSFDFDRDLDAVRNKIVGGETLDSSWNTRNRDLEEFKQAGGKVIQYHGWDDPNIPSLEAVKLFTTIVADQARRHRLTPQQALDVTQQFYRLFMVPGMGHCAGGDGPASFGQSVQSTKGDPESDALSALERWVETGVAPEQFTGSRVDARTRAVDMTRPVCAYPKIPVWKGSGSTTEASNFVCAANPQSSLKVSK